MNRGVVLGGDGGEGGGSASASGGAAPAFIADEANSRIAVPRPDSYVSQ